MGRSKLHCLSALKQFLGTSWVPRWYPGYHATLFVTISISPPVHGTSPRAPTKWDRGPQSTCFCPYFTFKSPTCKKCPNVKNAKIPKSLKSSWGPKSKIRAQEVVAIGHLFAFQGHISPGKPFPMILLAWKTSMVSQYGLLGGPAATARVGPNCIA